MISELVSEFIPDDVLACGESGGGKAKKWDNREWILEVGRVGV